MATPHATEIGPTLRPLDLEARMHATPERILLVSNNNKLLAAAHRTDGFKRLIGTDALLYVADGRAALDRTNPYSVFTVKYGLVVLDLYAFMIGSEELTALHRSLAPVVEDAEIIGINGSYVGCERGHHYPEGIDLHHLGIILEKAHDPNCSQLLLEEEFLSEGFTLY